MDAVKYIREKARMCNSFNLCDECPLYGIKSTGPTCDGDRPEESVSIVEQWSCENPGMTNAQQFEEVFGFEPVKTVCIGVAQDTCDESECSSCKNWWDEPYKEPEGKK